MAKRAQLTAQKKGWWHNNGVDRAGTRAKGLFGGGGEVEEGLVRVLSGEEEIANLRTPKGIMITGPPGEPPGWRVFDLDSSLAPVPRTRPSA
jgi:hypothetical protein